jgi:hypothetical protein
VRRGQRAASRDAVRPATRAVPAAVAHGSGRCAVNSGKARQRGPCAPPHAGPKGPILIDSPGPGPHAARHRGHRSAVSAGPQTMRHGRGGPALRPGRLCTTPPLLVDARYRAGRAPLGVPSKGSLNEQFRLPQARSPPSTMVPRRKATRPRPGAPRPGQG